MNTPHGFSDFGIAYPSYVEKYVHTICKIAQTPLNPDAKTESYVNYFLELLETQAARALNSYAGEDRRSFLQQSEEAIGMVAANLKAVLVYGDRLREHLAKGDHDAALIDMFLIGAAFVRADMMEEAQTGAAVYMGKQKGGQADKQLPAVKEAVRTAVKAGALTPKPVWEYLKRNYQDATPFRYGKFAVYFPYGPDGDELFHVEVDEDGDERADGTPIAYRTIERYVKKVRDEEGIKKTKKPQVRKAAQS